MYIGREREVTWWCCFPRSPLFFRSSIGSPNCLFNLDWNQCVLTWYYRYWHQLVFYMQTIHSLFWVQATYCIALHSHIPPCDLLHLFYHCVLVWDVIFMLWL